MSAHACLTPEWTRPGHRAADPVEAFGQHGAHLQAGPDEGGGSSRTNRTPNSSSARNWWLTAPSVTCSSAAALREGLWAGLRGQERGLVHGQGVGPPDDLHLAAAALEHRVHRAAHVAAERALEVREQLHHDAGALRAARLGNWQSFAIAAMAAVAPATE